MTYGKRKSHLNSTILRKYKTPNCENILNKKIPTINGKILMLFSMVIHTTEIISTSSSLLFICIHIIQITPSIQPPPKLTLI